MVVSVLNEGLGLMTYLNRHAPVINNYSITAETADEEECSNNDCEGQIPELQDILQASFASVCDPVIILPGSFFYFHLGHYISFEVSLGPLYHLKYHNYTQINGSHLGADTTAIVAKKK